MRQTTNSEVTPPWHQSERGLRGSSADDCWGCWWGCWRESNYFGGGWAARRNGGVGGVRGVEASRIFSSINSTIESVRSGVFIRNFICVSRSGKCSDLIVQIVEFSDFIAYWYSKTEGNSLDSLSASIMHSESYTHVEG